MLKKTITYTDYDGLERTEDFYFNLTKAELLEMETSSDGGFVKRMEKIIAAKSIPQIVKVIKDLVLRSYGEKSDNGKRFIKSPAIRDAFAQTEAYSILFMELSTNTQAASDFVNGIVPADLAPKKNAG